MPAGAIKLDLKYYGLGQQWKGRRVTATISALDHTVSVYTAEGKLIKVLPRIGVSGP